MIPYLNLTSGLELRPLYPTARLVRIQSSHLEAHAFSKAIAALDYQFLFDAADEGVLLLDCWSRKPPLTRAQWQGVPWLKYAYAAANKQVLPQVPSQFENDFEFMYLHGLERDDKSKLRYVFKMTQASELRIECFGAKSTLDGQYEELAKCL